VRQVIRSLQALALAVLAASGSACIDDGTTSALTDVIVRPRVILDGTVELGSRTNGRVLINTVTAHAPGARVLAVSDVSSGGDVVVDDTDPLFFRYAPSQADAQTDTERLWSLPESGGLLRLAFGPATDDAAAAAPFAADGLVGHTVVIAGSIAIEDDGLGSIDDVSAGFQAGDDRVGETDPDGTLAETDPDGTLADGETDPDGTLADGETDPDGTLADGADGQAAETDPDGTLADGADGQVAETDPDGTLASTDPDGTLASTDPDGTPAEGESLIARIVKSPASKGAKKATANGAMVGRPQKRVPFTLTVDGAFQHDAWIDGDSISSLSEGEVLPVDVRFAAEVFFDADRLAVLEALAGDAARVGDEGASLQVSAAATSLAVDVEVKGGVAAKKVDAKTSTRTSRRIVVTGPNPR